MIISANYQQENFQILMMRRVTLTTNRVEKNDNCNIYNKEDIVRNLWVRFSECYR